MSAAKGQLGTDKAELTLAGNTFSVGAGMMRGFYGDWAHDYVVIYDPPCRFDDRSAEEYKVNEVSAITFVWSSWKDEPVDVYPNLSKPPAGYFNPPSPYADEN